MCNLVMFNLMRILEDTYTENYPSVRVYFHFYHISYKYHMACMSTISCGCLYLYSTRPEYHAILFKIQSTTTIATTKQQHKNKIKVY